MRIPIFPLQVVLFPGASLPLHIFEPRYKDMILACQSTGSGFGVVHAERDQLSVIGCMASIISTLEKYEDGRVDILTRGAHRFHIVSLDESAPYLQAEVNFLPDDTEPAPRELREQAAAKHFEYLERSGSGVEAMAQIQLDQPVSFQLADALPIPFVQQQSLLSTDSDTQRTMMLLQIYDELLNDLRMHGTGQGKRSRMVH
jgi:Lon protease-like protein